MKKLLVMVIALAVVFGMSAGVMAWGPATETVDVEVTIEEYAELFVQDNIEFNFTESASKTEIAWVNLVTNHNVILSAEVTQDFVTSDITISNAEIHSDPIAPGTYMDEYYLFVNVDYSMTGETPAGSYSDGEVTVTLASH